MASARKIFTRTRPQDVAAPQSDVAERAVFINALLRNEIQATAAHESRTPQGALRIEYDDPDGGPGASGGGTGTRTDTIAPTDPRTEPNGRP
jgi:hypothetical protein